MSPRKKASGLVGNERERLSFGRCRMLIGSGCMLTDNQLSAVRDQLYMLAEVVVSLAPDAAAREAVTERAAILEAEGLPRASAEREAALLHLRGRV